MDEDWDLLVSFLPSEWRELAKETGALKGLRKDKSVDNLLRTLLIHIWAIWAAGTCYGRSLVARQPNLADLSDVALLKRPRKSKDWLYALRVRLFQEHGIVATSGGGFQLRAVRRDHGEGTGQDLSTHPGNPHTYGCARQPSTRQPDKRQVDSRQRCG